MNTICKGYQCKTIPSFKHIFKKCIECLNEVAHEWKKSKDVPWWYNERASLSLFAGAIWRADGFCFEEYSEEKRAFRKRSHRLGDAYHGRVDLYFSWHRKDFIAEAKGLWSGFGQRNEEAARERLDRYLKKACKDIRQTAPRGQRRLGIVFVQPYFRRKFKGEIDSKLKQWVEMLAGLDTSAYAWAFPPCARHISSNGYFCPGQAVLIKEVWK